MYFAMGRGHQKNGVDKSAMEMVKWQVFSRPEVKRNETEGEKKKKKKEKEHH